MLRPMTEEISAATTDDDYAQFGSLVREYWVWLQARYADLPGFIDAVGGHQALERELDSLRETYGPPTGGVLLARIGGEAVGGVAFRDLGDGSCEMKRLFVPDRYQGQGIGRRLCLAVLDAAESNGYAFMRLDTGFHNDEARAMYESLGFRERGPFHDYPADLLPHLRFMDKPLGHSVAT
jgi:ribosomal protein S18 acetylase RimI-like enzyme